MKTKNCLLGLLVCIGVAACGETQQEEPAVRAVRTMQVGLSGNESVRTFNGQARTDRVIDLSFRAAGVITKLDLTLGAAVSKGELLAELDNVAARLSYEQANASLNSARSNLDTQKLALNRVENLYEKGGSSLSDYENAKNAYRNAQASFRSAQRSVDIQQEQIRYGKIFAPEDGVISAVNKELEENVAAGETIAVLNAGSEMEIELGVPENVINKVSKDTRSEISFAALSGQLFEGEVSEVSPAVDPQTATYPVRVRVVNATQEVKSGMAATVVFDFSDAQGTQSETVMVPAYAVGEDDRGRYVFLVESTDDGGQVVRKQEVVLGELRNNAFEVESGIRLGDTIITAGVHSVLDGQRVRVAD